MAATSGGRGKEEALAASLEVLPVAGTDVMQPHAGRLLGSMAAQTMAGTSPWHLGYHLLASRSLETHLGARSPDKLDSTAEDQMPGKGSLGPSGGVAMDRPKDSDLPENPPTWDFGSRYTQGSWGGMKASQEASAGPTRGKNPPESSVVQPATFEWGWTLDFTASQCQDPKGHGHVRQLPTRHYKRWPGAN